MVLNKYCNMKKSFFDETIEYLRESYVDNTYDRNSKTVSIPVMELTLRQINKHLTNSSTVNEAFLIENHIQDVILELFGGLKNLMGAGKQAVQAGGRAVGNVAKAGASAIANKAQQAAVAGEKAVNGVKAAGRNIGNNVKNIYQTGNQVSQSTSSIKNTQKSLKQLVDLINQAQSQGLIDAAGREMGSLTLQEVSDLMDQALQSANQNSQQARANGITGGTRQAFSQGAQS